MIGHFRHLVYLFKRLYWDYKWKVFALILLGFLGSLFDALSIGILVPLFSFILKDASPGDDAISKAIFGFFDYFSIAPSMNFLLALICVLFILKAGTAWLFEYAMSVIANRFLAENRRQLYAELLTARWPYLIQQKIGYLDNIIMADLKNAAGLFKMLIAIAAAAATFGSYLLIAISLSYQITAMTVVFGLIVFLLMKSIFSKAQFYSRKTVELSKKVAHFINESIVGLKLVKAIGAERRIAAKGGEIFERSADLAVKTFLAKSPTAFIEPVSVIFIAAVFAVSYYLDPNLNIAAFLAIMYLVQRIFDFLKRIQANFLALYGDIPHAERVVRFKDELASNLEADSGKLNFAFTDKLEFRQVSFFYNNVKSIFEDLDLIAKKGELTAIIGRTGVGKTTIADLLLRLLEPTQGGIFLDGVNIKEIKLSDWRRKVGYVSQDIFLKNDTIANNIKFFSEEITDAEMIDAAKRANIYDFIESLPDKFNTIVGERGIYLSGGQRQRIALARAFACRPEILILDEATSSLDAQSEAAIKESISKFKGHLTVIVISHRLPFIKDADKVFVLSDGKIAESGRPSELLKDANSYFHRLYYAPEKH